MVGARFRVGDCRGKDSLDLKHTAWWLEQRSTPLEEWELSLGFESEEQRWRERERERECLQAREKTLKKKSKIKNANCIL